MLQKLIYKSRKFLKKNGSTILTYIGAAGVVGTAVVAVKATPKALSLLNSAEKEKGEELTTFEKVIAAAPVYIPSVVVGASTITCIFGANILNKRQQAALASAYMVLDNSYKEYKNKVVEVLGKEGEKSIREEIAKDHLKGAKRPTTDEKVTFYEEHSNRYFEMTMDEYRDAIYQFNRSFILQNYASLNELYTFFGLPKTKSGGEIGWSVGAGMEWYGYQWVDFELEPVTLDDGFECYIIKTPFEPTMDYMNY